MTDLHQAIATIAATRHLLVALDFDGTLAPLVDDPDLARALPRALDAVVALAELPDTSVALISGRAMDSLVRVSEVPDSVLLSGSHGVEVRLAATPELTVTPDEADRLSRLRAVLDGIASRYQHVWVEAKPAGFALHTRLASQADAEAAGISAVAAVQAIPGLTTRRGSNVLEFSVRTTNKGDALQTLREHSGATAVLFAGDDVTDEDAFSVLGAGDLGLKCGQGETLAEFRVNDPGEVADVLHQVAIERSGGVRP
jgi:trehalose 6-phosphate phosphatase